MDAALTARAGVPAAEVPAAGAPSTSADSTSADSASGPSASGPAGGGNSTDWRDVVIVGGGICGISCARELQRHGIAATVLDRGRRPGGRLASPELAGRITDIGASYFTVTDPAFAEVVERWRAAGLARPWTDTLDVLNGSDSGKAALGAPKTGPVRWAAPAGLRALALDLAAGLDVRSGHTVTSIGYHGGPTVDGNPAAAVVLAMPDPQARRLLQPAPELDQARELLATLDYDPVYAVTASWAQRCWPFADAAFVNGDDTVAFLADDGARRGDGAPVLVAHSTTALARKYLQDSDEALAEILRSLGELLDLPTAPAFAAAHRWTFAKPAGTHDAAPFALTDANLGLAGDSWCPSGSPRVESAWLSGTALGAALAVRLKNHDSAIPTQLTEMDR